MALFFACGEKHGKEGTPFDEKCFVLKNPVQLPDDLNDGDKSKDVEGLKLYNPRLSDPRNSQTESPVYDTGSEQRDNI